MQDFTDQDDVVISGQNPYMMLFREPAEDLIATVSFWRVSFSPMGPGHVLFLRGSITNGESRLYTDNIAVARFIQDEIYANNRAPFGHFADNTLDAIDAQFIQSGDARSHITETVTSRYDFVSLSWYDFLPAYKGGTAANPALQRGHGHYALYIPARRVRLAINGALEQATPKARIRDGRPTTSAALSWAETWIRPST
jgi:hypothetical protein